MVWQISRINVIKKIEAQQFIDDDESQPPTTNAYKSSGDPSSSGLQRSLNQSANQSANPVAAGGDTTGNITTVSEMPSAVAAEDETMNTEVMEEDGGDEDDEEMRWIN